MTCYVRVKKKKFFCCLVYNLCNISNEPYADFLMHFHFLTDYWWDGFVIMEKHMVVFTLPSDKILVLIFYLLPSARLRTPLLCVMLTIGSILFIAVHHILYMSVETACCRVPFTEYKHQNLYLSLNTWHCVISRSSFIYSGKLPHFPGCSINTLFVITRYVI